MSLYIFEIFTYHDRLLYHKRLKGMSEEIGNSEVHKIPEGQRESTKKAYMVSLYNLLYADKYYPQVGQILEFTGDRDVDRKKVKEKKDEFTRKYHAGIPLTDEERVLYHMIQHNKVRRGWFAGIRGVIDGLVDDGLLPPQYRDEAHALVEEVEKKRRTLGEFISSDMIGKKYDDAEEGHLFAKAMEKAGKDIGEGSVTKEDTEKGDHFIIKVLYALHPSVFKVGPGGTILSIDKRKLRRYLRIQESKEEMFYE